MNGGLPARAFAQRILSRWFSCNDYLEHILKFDDSLPDLRDRRFAESLIHKVIQNQRLLENILQRFYQKDPPLNVRLLLMTGSCEILLMQVPDHAALFSTVELCQEIAPHAKSFVNAVLRKVLEFRDRKWPHFLEDPLLPPGVRYGFPDWLIARWSAQFGAETPQLLQSLNERPFKMARITRSGERERILSELQERGIAVENSAYHPDFLQLASWQALLQDPLFLEGQLLAQDVSAVFPVLMIARDNPESVADVCAAPGGKLSALRQYCPPGTRIEGYDRSEKRLQICEENLRRLGIRDIPLNTADAANHTFPEYSHILIDAPCSGFGVIRKRPDLRWRRKAADLPLLQRLQLQILQNCAPFVRKGGLLVYSTCTFDREENLGTIGRFLEKNTHFRIENTLCGVVPPDLQTPEGAVATYPQRHLCEGSFAISLRKY
ncbi:MAG: transcription antitermination factor NusB [Candidatus Neomarinimicrobiota bacterium]|jgi:16S rRNA (cytosine967-C5)-methyltransferase|nr:transcription antitermination factor NusB [Candidatus Neomarinimicrobiota bacterium]MDD4961867.1 transcription antitermination factor NusB [Candidatus Neomarinimicrobiota bacterium]MDX9780764.1 transcription antitermination factor NusB [bacterium]